MMKHKAREVTVEVISLFLFVFILFCLWATCSCGSQGVKMVDEFKKAEKRQEETKAELKVQGENNTQHFSKIEERMEINIQNSIKTSEQIKDGNKVTAEKIGKVENEVTSVKNSSWMVWGITAVIALIAVIAISGIIYVAYLLIKNIRQIDKAIDDDDNTLTREKYNECK